MDTDDSDATDLKISSSCCLFSLSLKKQMIEFAAFTEMLKSATLDTMVFYQANLYVPSST